MDAAVSFRGRDRSCRRGCPRPVRVGSSADARFRQTGGRPDRGQPQGDGKGLPVQPPQKIDLNSGPGKEAFDFLKSVGEGSARAERLSAPVPETRRPTG